MLGQIGKYAILPMLPSSDFLTSDLSSALSFTGSSTCAMVILSSTEGESTEVP